MFTHESNVIPYEVFDGCFATALDHSKAGTYLRLDNGETAFAFKFNLCPGTKVLCTVLKMATDTRFKLVSIDSVIYSGVA